MLQLSVSFAGGREAWFDLCWSREQRRRKAITLSTAWSPNGEGTAASAGFPPCPFIFPKLCPALFARGTGKVFGGSSIALSFELPFTGRNIHPNRLIVMATRHHPLIRVPLPESWCVAWLVPGDLAPLGSGVLADCGGRWTKATREASSLEGISRAGHLHRATDLKRWRGQMKFLTSGHSKGWMIAVTHLDNPR